jgi:hypothetical protein
MPKNVGPAAEPVLQKLYRCVELERPNIVHESPVTKAMNYLLNQRVPLARFLAD